MPWKTRTTPLTASPSAENLGAAIKRLSSAVSDLAKSQWEHQVFREQAALRVVQMAQQLESLQRGTLEFASTETWRTVYEAVLESCENRRYLSAALIISEDYWRDRPGQVSLEFNYKLVQHGFSVARLLVIEDFFWPRQSRLPDKHLLAWAQEQQSNGVEVAIARLSEVEPDLRLDFGVYGEVAAGYQVTDEQGRTDRYYLRFDRPSISQAEDLWRKLELFTRPLTEVIADRSLS